MSDNLAAAVLVARTQAHTGADISVGVNFLRTAAQVPLLGDGRVPPVGDDNFVLFFSAINVLEDS